MITETNVSLIKSQTPKQLEKQTGLLSNHRFKLNRVLIKSQLSSSNCIRVELQGSHVHSCSCGGALEILKNCQHSISAKLYRTALSIYIIGKSIFSYDLAGKLFFS